MTSFAPKSQQTAMLLIGLLTDNATQHTFGTCWYGFTMISTVKSNFWETDICKIKLEKRNA